jgi:hypothetical protein
VKKTLANLRDADDLVKEAVEEFKLLSEVKYELAKEAYDAQDEATRDMIDQLHRVLRIHATGYVTIQLSPPHGAVVPVKVEQQYVDFNLLYIVMDMLSNLALFDIRVGSYTFPKTLCANCESQIVQSQAQTRKARR